MRKRLQHSKSKFQTRVPTIIIMVLALVFILYYGKDFSKLVAGVFTTNTPVTDAPVAVQDGPGMGGSDVAPEPRPSKTGTVISQAYKNAAQDTLKVLSNGQ